MSTSPGELVVLLDEEGNPAGSAPKSEVHHQDTPLHLAFSVYVFDPAGRFLLTRRALSKRTWPGAWTNSCCGHPAPGERVEDAVRRRVREELGLELTGLRCLLPGFRYRAVMDDGTVENELCPVYAATALDPATVTPEPGEVQELEWVEWDTWRQAVLAGDREASPWCVSQLAALPPDPRDGASAT